MATSGRYKNELYSNMDGKVMVPKRRGETNNVDGAYQNFSQKSSQPRPGLRGLVNYGFNCYVNSVLQCLNHVADVKDYFYNFHQPSVPRNLPLTTAFSEHIKEQWSDTSRNHVIDTQVLQLYLGEVSSRFGGSQQQDAYEALITLLNAMHEELKTKEDESKIKELFQGEMRSTIICCKCRIPFSSKNMILSLQLQVPEQSIQSSKSCSPCVVKLEDCIASLNSKFQYAGENQWFCDNCQHPAFTNAEQTSYLWKLPKVLIVQLQRFNIYSESYKKNDRFVDFPLDNLDLTRFVQGPQKNERIVYELVAVSNHFGSFLGGHYKTVAKNHLNDTWYEFDDTNVNELRDGDKIRSNSAYILIYRQKLKQNTEKKDFINVSKHTKSTNESRNNLSLNESDIKYLTSVYQVSTEYSDNPTLGLRGLISTGSSYHMNSALQCLTHIQDVKDYFYDFYGPTSTRNTPLSTAFSYLVKDLWSKQHRDDAADPRFVEDNIKKLWLRYNSQQQIDPHELLILLINAIHDELKNEEEHSKMEELFFVKIQSTIDSSACNRSGPSFDPIPCLRLQIPAGSSISHTVKLEDCIREFNKTNQCTDAAAQLYKTKNYERCIDQKRRFSLWKVPKVLIIKLQRFNIDSHTWKKIEKFVDYPLDNLDLSVFVEGPQKGERLTYALIAVSNHFGSYLDGHYTAFVKSHLNGKWYEFDDTEVKEITNDKIKNENACMLIYQSRK